MNRWARLRLRIGWLSGPWRRSLQLRVVATTMLLGVLAAAALGTLLMQRIQTGLVQQRLTQAKGEARSGLAVAQEKFEAAGDSSELNILVNDLLPRLASPDPDTSREIILLRSAENTRQVIIPELKTRAVVPEIVAPSFRKRVVASETQEVEFTRITYDSDQAAVPGILFGATINIPNAGEYELYFVFSLERERRTIDLVHRSLLIGGALLVLLVGGVSFVVTQQVVRPVRQAALVAHRLSSGRLHERMVARGEDDLALLAASFNSMAQNLQLQITQLEHLSTVQQRFVSDVSHELRTPLTTIRMAGEVIHEARPDFSPAVARSAELLHAQIDRFESLLADLLEMSRVDAGGSLLELAETDLLKIIQTVIDGCSPLIVSSGSTIDIATEQSAQGSLIISVDTRRIERILRNLVVNALEHGEGHPIQIRTGATSDAVAVTVRDFGVGLKPGETSLVFNRFWRADTSRARTVGGTGLGLAISLEDTRLHGGWLQAWGAPGLGSCFRLTLPRVAGQDILSSPLPLSPIHDPVHRVGGPYQQLPQPHRMKGEFHEKS